MKTIQEICAYKAHQVEQRQQHADFDMVIEHLQDIPRREGIDKTSCEMFEKMACALIDIMGEYNWLDPLYDTLEEDRRRELDEDGDLPF